jgi:dimethylhistidine N-methyltransferase
MVEASVQEFADDVHMGLSRPGQKAIPSKHLYDPVGSALFEAITFLPEYGLTRADERVLQQLAPELPRLLGASVRVAELGSGTGAKTRGILEALSSGAPVPYHPIDVSAAALAACRIELNGLCVFQPHLASYIDGLREVARFRHAGERLLVLFLGSTIGNFLSGEAARFLADVRRVLRPGDALLLGADLMKPVPTLLLAYDDPAGVTAAFNKNVLARVNRELGGNFHLPSFAHEVRFSHETRSIEMHLRAVRKQDAYIPAARLRVRMEIGETIWTESSRKFTEWELDDLAAAAGFELSGRWIDREWLFAESLLLAP